MRFKTLLLGLLLALCVFPALAQDTTANTASFNGFSFSFPSAVANNVNISQFAGDPTTLDQPGGPEVKHTQFLLYTNTPAPESIFEGVGGIRVYKTADFSGYDFASRELQNLQTLLAQRPDLTSYMVGDPGNNSLNLPFMPVANAAQVIRARAQYVDGATLKGVSYLTAYRQDVSPFTGSEFIYTFQGLSGDGTSYVVAIFPLNTTLFPAEIPANFDMNTFGQQLNTYFTQSIATLNNAKPEDFTPSLATFDTMIQSFALGSAPVTTQPQQPATTVPQPSATATSSDATMGGLAGVTWTLASYGDPANLRPVLPGKAVTAVFAQSGVSGSAGCNGYGGAFQYSGNSITISQLVHTMMACEQPILDQENAFLDALSKATSYQINGTQLQISYDGGVLTFAAS